MPESSQPPATWAGEEAAVWPLWDALILHERDLGTQQDLPLLSPGGPLFNHRRFASCKCVYVFGGFWTNHHKRINEPLFCQPIINRLLYSPNSALSICYLCVMTNTEVRKWRNTASLILMVSIGDHPGGIPWRLRELGRAAVFDDARLDPGVGQTDCLDSKLPFVVILLPFSRRVSALRLASLTILSGWVWYKAGSKEMVMKPLKFLAIMRWWWHRHCRSGSCFNCYSDFCAQVSVGLENCQDLIADLDQALRTAIKCWQKW